MDRPREIADAAENMNAWLADLSALRPYCEGHFPEFAVAWQAAILGARNAAANYTAVVTAHVEARARAAQMAALKAQEVSP
jgi:hypothetical protein